MPRKRKLANNEIESNTRLQTLPSENAGIKMDPECEGLDVNYKRIKTEDLQDVKPNINDLINVPDNEIKVEASGYDATGKIGHRKKSLAVTEILDVSNIKTENIDIYGEDGYHTDNEDDESFLNTSTELQIKEENVLEIESVICKAEPYVGDGDVEDSPDNDDYESATTDDETIDGSVTKAYKCDICNFSTGNQKQLRRHTLNNCKLEDFNCNQCSFASVSKQGLRSHILNRHSQKQYKCSSCSYSTACFRYYKLHFSRKHLRSVLHQCDKCDFSTTYLSSLYNHKQMHIKKQSRQEIKCSDCSYSTTSEKLIMRHKNRHRRVVNEKEEAYIQNIMSTNAEKADTCYNCSECSYTCKYVALLIAHSKIHQSSKK